MVQCKLHLLPAELLIETLSYLERDTVALHNLCLAGDQAILSHARPLTWRHIHIRGQTNANADSNSVSQRFLNFTADSSKASAVRAL